MTRWIGFTLAILVGIAAGLYYGWVVNPVEYVDTTPVSLRIDYRSDYVLMVAEAYSADHNLAVAVRRLALLGDAPPAETVNQAILFAESQAYSDADLELMRVLHMDLQSWNPILETRLP